MRIALLAYVEPSAEHPDAVVAQVAEALTEAGHSTTTLTVRDDVKELIAALGESKPDLVFNLAESFGRDLLGGEVGVAGLLDLMHLAYTGGGPGELFLQQDKGLAKKLLAYEQTPYPDFAIFPPNADFETGGHLRMPLFVKPLRTDASIGIDEKSLVRNTQQLLERVLHIHKTLGDAALAEEYIEGREFYVGVIGNEEPIAFPPVEMDFSGLEEGRVRIMDTAAKFDTKSDRFRGTRAVVADLDDELRAKLQQVSLSAYRALRVRDYGRVDLRLTESGEIYVIEVNANCYLERGSEYASAAAAHGIEYPALLDRIARLAVDRFAARNRIERRLSRALAG